MPSNCFNRFVLASPRRLALPIATYPGLSLTGATVREAVNNWIRTSRAYDGVIDFEAATRDKDNPKRLRAEFDPGDHLHPNDAGYQAMADAVDLSIFTGKRPAAPQKRR